MAKKSEQEVHAAIVEQAKAAAAKKPPGQVTGDQVSHEIAKQWAEHKGRPFDKPAPPGPDGLSTATGSPAAERPVSPIAAKSDEGKPLEPAEPPPFEDDE